MRTASLRATATCAGLLLLAGCAGSTDDARASAPSTPPASAAASTVVSETATASPTTEPSKTATPSLVPITTPAATPTPTPTPSEAAAAPPIYVKNLPEGAYPGAGGPLPEGATEIWVKYGGEIPIFQTPSKKIQCYLDESMLDNIKVGCLVYSWIAERKYPSDEGAYSRAAVVFASDGFKGPFHQGGASPANLELDPQIIDYGQIAHVGDYACASLDTGMTCWNLTTGNGALINRSGYYPFYRDN